MGGLGRIVQIATVADHLNQFRRAFAVPGCSVQDVVPDLRRSARNQTHLYSHVADGQADSWQKFVDFWAIDWNYGSRVGEDGKPIFETDWQSFRLRKSKGETEPLVFTADLKYTDPGQYRIAARVTDVFGNDGIATVNVEVK